MRIRKVINGLKPEYRAVIKGNSSRELCVKAFINLIEIYEGLPLSKIEGEWKKTSDYCSTTKGDYVAWVLTGFGNTQTCKLCRIMPPHTVPSYRSCVDCVWKIATGNWCAGDGNRDSYKRIEWSESPKKLKAAYVVRAKHMKKALKRIFTKEMYEEIFNEAKTS